mmetsp:Transcript_33807/g.75970  ORF Transcript_33807/g.75970 Transcript_33807/m.75970 type:complete len:289 (-) Transcript_33807:484-1350(-)
MHILDGSLFAHRLHHLLSLVCLCDSLHKLWRLVDQRLERALLQLLLSQLLGCPALLLLSPALLMLDAREVVEGVGADLEPALDARQGVELGSVGVKRGVAVLDVPPHRQLGFSLPGHVPVAHLVPGPASQLAAHPVDLGLEAVLLLRLRLPLLVRPLPLLHHRLQAVEKASCHRRILLALLVDQALGSLRKQRARVGGTRLLPLLLHVQLHLPHKLFLPLEEGVEGRLAADARVGSRLGGAGWSRSSLPVLGRIGRRVNGDLRRDWTRTTEAQPGWFRQILLGDLHVA